MIISGTRQMNKHKKFSRFWIYAIIFIVIVLFLCSYYLHYAWHKYQKIASAEAIILAESLESLLHTEHILLLEGSDEDLEKSEYIMLKESLARLVKTENIIRFAYLLAEKDRNIVILLDSESPDSPDYSPPGQIYEEAEDIYWEPFLKGETVLTNPTTDRWGTWISALVPIENPADGSIIAVFGLDYSASEWYVQLYKQIIPDIIIVICILMLVLALLGTLVQQSKLRKLSSKLAFDEALYHSVFDQAPIGIALVNDKSFVLQSEYGHVSMNPMFERILGRTSQELANIKWTEITHRDDIKADLEKFGQFKTGKISGYSMEKRFIKPDGSSVWTNMKISHLQGRGDDEAMHLCLLEDITTGKEMEDSLIESERTKAVLLSNLPGMAYRCKYDRDWTMEFVSAGCLNLTGYSPDSIINNKYLSFNEIITPEYRDVLWNEWKLILPKKLPFKFEYEIETAEGERKWVLEMGQGIHDEAGNVFALEGMILDISDRKLIEDKLRYNNDHDELTGLFNRNYLENLLNGDGDSYTEKNSLQKRAIISINLSPIQALNTQYGFHYAQELIKKTAEALKIHCTGNRILFKTYENRFVFYVKDYEGKNEIDEFCRAVTLTLESVLTIERIGGGIGVLEIDRDAGLNADQLLKKILILSERAIDKGDKDIGICFYDSEIEIQISREEEIKRELTRIATTDDEKGLFLHYQPIFDLKTNQIYGFEALARLTTEKLGRVPPLEFIPLAEKNKLIVPIGMKIMRQAFGFINYIKSLGYDDISVSVNVSAIQLLKSDFSKNLLDLIEEMQVNPSNIGIEITESILAEDYDEINRIILGLRKYGIYIAIDDFGTGYSSLAREQELNINCLKIDKYFIDKLMSKDADSAIAGDIISMAHKLGHCSIAEGVEHDEQRNYLMEHGCDKIQGYLISKPLDEKSAIEFLEKQKNI